MNILKIVAVWIMCFVYNVSSKTIESSIFMSFSQAFALKYAAFVNGVLTLDPNAPTDLYFGMNSDGPYSGVSYYMADYKTGVSLLRVGDTSALDFQKPLPLLDGTLFPPEGNSYLSAGPYGMEEYFLFPLHAGNYAFCHGTLNDTSYATTTGTVSYLTRMYLACQVQDDGTTKFDSIPQYPWGAVAVRPQLQRLIRPSVVPLYHVNGTPVVGNEGQMVRVGKQ